MGKIKCLNCGTELTMISNAACPACGIRLSHVKISFLAYLGPEDSLAGYQRSYKLVLLKSIFEECLSGNSPKVRTVADRFRAYYLRRKQNGLLIDKDVDSRIADIESSSLEDVFEVIKMNPYNAIRKQGFLKIDELNGVFVLQRGIDDLSNVELNNILILLREKLKLYYKKIGSEALEDEAAETVSAPKEQTEPEISVRGEPLIISDGKVDQPALKNISIPADLSTMACTLEDLNLSNRAYNALRRNGVHTTEEMSEALLSGKIQGFKNIGAQTVAELEGVVKGLRDGTFVPGMASVAQSFDGQTEAVAELKISDTIEAAYPENSFNLFRQYCAQHNLCIISDLASFDFDLLFSADGFGTAKVERAKKRYLSLAQKLNLPTQMASSDSETLVNYAFEVIHESNLTLPVSILRLFGYTPKAIRTIQEAGIFTFSDLQKVGHEAVVKLVGKQKAAELREILRNFEAPLHEIGEGILDECAKDRNFEIYIQRANGDSLQAVADEFGLTRERIRQICLKFENRILPIMQAIAETILIQNESAYFTEEQLLEIFDDDNYDKVIVASLKNCSEYTYLDFAKTFVRNVEYPDAEAKLQNLAVEIVGDGINLFEKLDEVESALSSAGYSFVTADGFVDLLIKHNFKLYGDYVIRTRKSYGLLCAEIVADEFPDGLHISDDEEITRLRNALEAKYGKLDVPESNRSFVSRIASFLVQAGRSTYIAPKNIIIDDDVLLDIKAYIDNLTYQDVYYNQLFAEYEGILMMTSNVDNPGFLHGVLAWRFPDDYVYSRDFLRKPDAAETASLAEQIKDILVEAGCPLTKKQITSHFPGVTDAMFNNAFYSAPCLIQWEYGIYNCSDNLKVDADEISQMRELVKRLLHCNDGYCSQELLYKHAIRELPAVCKANQVNSAQNIFYIAAYLLGEDYLFNRPHIAEKGRFTELDVKTIALELLGCPKILSAEDFFALAKKFEWSDVTASLVFSNIEKEYVRLDKNTYQQAETFELSEHDQEFAADLLRWSASDEWYLPLQRFADSEESTPGGIRVNEFVMSSIVRKYGLGWQIVSPQTKDRRYEKGILVRDNLNITAYDQLIAKILSDAGIYSLTASRLLSFLQIHQLTFKTIPKELEVSEYFAVSDDQFNIVKWQES